MALESSTSHIIIPPARVVLPWCLFIIERGDPLYRYKMAAEIGVYYGAMYFPAIPYLRPKIVKEIRDGQQITIDTWDVSGIPDFSDPAKILENMKKSHLWQDNKPLLLQGVATIKTRLPYFSTFLTENGFKQYEPDFLSEVEHKQREVDKICNNCRLESEILEFYAARLGQHHTPNRNFTNLKAALNTFHDKIAEQRAAFEIFVEKRIAQIKAGDKTNLAAAIEVQNYEFNFTELEKRMRTMRAMKHDDHAIEYEDNLFGEAYLTTREPIKRQKVLGSINASSSLWANG